MGIIDRKYINDQNSFEEKRRQCIFYCAFNGNIAVSGQMTGCKGRTGANQDQTIIMKV